MTQAETAIVNNCIMLLEQALSMLERVDDAAYASTNQLSPRGSIGGHLRHVLDFYENFFSGLGLGRIDYNRRNRDPLTEQSRSYATDRVKDTIALLASLSVANVHQTVLVRTEEIDESRQVWCASSVLRELDYLQSHTIHHYSVVAMLLRLHEIDPGLEFGVAPSTLNNWRKEAACAQ